MADWEQHSVVTFYGQSSKKGFNYNFYYSQAVFFCCCLAIFGLAEELDKPRLSINIKILHFSHLLNVLSVSTSRFHVLYPLIRFLFCLP
jgi:hypothetical protein